MPLVIEGKPPSLDARYRLGYFGGFEEGSNTYVILTEQGAVRCRSIRRRPLSERWDVGLLTCQYTTLQPSPLRPGEERIGVNIPTGVESTIPTSTRSTPDTDLPTRGAQRLRMNKKDFELHGWTYGCPGCEARKHGAICLASHPPNHSEQCRKRMECILAGID